MAMTTQITMHFTLDQLCATQTAKARGATRAKPGTAEIINLVYLAAYVLEPLREAMGEPIKIGNGFRWSAAQQGRWRCRQLTTSRGRRQTSASTR